MRDTDQLEFRAAAVAVSQIETIYHMLRAAHGRPVSAVEMQQATGTLALSTRISQLRRERGLVIVNSLQFIRGKPRSTYQLSEEPPPHPPPKPKTKEVENLAGRSTPTP